MKELKLGIMKNQELADWFGVSLGTFKNGKKKKLEELKNFASFEEKAGKVNILEIYMPIYSKKGSRAYEMIKENIDSTWSQDGLDSCSRVSLELKDKLEDLPLAPATIYNYTRKSRNELYGVPFQEGGSLGKCTYLWCKKEGDGATAQYRRLTDEEEKIKQELITKYFGDATEKQIFVKGMVEMGEIKKEEAWEVLEELTNMKGGNFMGFLGELQAKLGCQVVRGTLVERNGFAAIEG